MYLLLVIVLVFMAIEIILNSDIIKRKMINNEYLKLFEQMKLELLDISKTSNDHISIKCLLCNNIFIATPKSKIANYKKHQREGCPKCTHYDRYADDRQNMIDLISNNGYQIISSYKDIHTKIHVINTKCGCGRSWWSQPLNLKYDDNVCRPCNDETKIKRMEYYNDMRSQNAIQNLTGFDKYEKEVQLITEKTYRKYIKLLSDDGLKIRGRGKYHLDHIIPVVYCFTRNIPVEICSHIDNLRMIHENDNITKNKKITTNIPKIFENYIPKNDKIESFVEMIQDELLTKFEILVELPNTVLHLYSPSHRIGIRLATFEECCQNNGGYKALYTPYKSAKMNNIRLISIYEDEWINNRSLVITKLKHILNENIIPKLNARDTIIKEITNDIKEPFLTMNHIQGNDRANISLGAYHNGMLVAVMTFANKKAFSSKGLAKPGWIELSRFCVDNKVNVRGIASKLLSYFKHNYKYVKLYSFCDLRWHDGKTYELMGFKAVIAQPLSYYYIIDNKRYHKWGYGKSSLKKLMGEQYDNTKTERQLTLSLGYDRIWDCGKIKYEMYKI